MPGPFESKALTGTFEKDISCIQQNDIWSSETFNNFVNTVYKLFYTESSYDHIFRNAGPGVQARLLWEKPLAGDDRDSESLSVPVLRFTATETENWNHIAVGMAPATNPDDYDHFERLCLVYGNGDLSRSARSYAMIHILRENTTTLAEDHAQYDTTINDNYCIIQCVYNLQTGAQEVPRRRRFHDLSEFVLRYDRSIPAGNTVITVTAGDKLIPGSDVPVKYTFTFGKSATFNNFVECVNSLKYQNFPLYNAVLVGEAAAADRTLWQALEFADTGTSTVTSKVIRFVPVRPAVTFYGWPDPKDKIGTLLTYVRPEESSTNAEAVFKYTGTYGFVLDNSIEAPVIQYAGEFKAPLVYVPNKNNYHHYEPAQSGSSPYPLPDWYEALTTAGVSLGTTQDFSADYFFLPLLTVHEKYVEFAGMTVSLETLLDRGETDIAIVPGSADSTDLESEIKYDSYRFTGETAPSVDVRKPLVDAADNVFEAFKPSLNAFEDSTSVPKLGRGVFAEESMLKTHSNAMALDRTLQAVVGLNWKLSNIIWIDPLLGPSDDESDPWKTCDRQRKMYPSVKLAILDDVKFGRGSIITPDTVFIHITDHQSDAPAYSNDPADDNYQNTDSAYHRNMWREIYSEYLPVGCRHIALRAVDGTRVTGAGFRLDYDHGPAPLYIRLLQDPGLTYDGTGVYSSEFFTAGLNHLHCRYRLTGEDKDLDTDYYPLRGQDFSLTSNVIIDDPEAGMRVVEKLTNVRIRLDGIKAERLSYVPRTHSLVDSSTRVYYSQTVRIHMGGNGVNDPAYAFTPSGSTTDWRPENWDKRGMLDWYLYNGEVLFQRCNINALNQSIELNSSPVVKGSCISFLNVNPNSVKTSILCQFGAAQPEPNGIRITIPAAGKLMLWRQEDYTCTAEVSELQLCGKGGTQVIEYAPVAWPFNVEYTSNASVIYVGSHAGVAYQYSVSSTGEVTGSASKNYLCRLGVSSPDSGRITGGSIYLTLRLDDRTKEFIYNAETPSARLWPQDCETRYDDNAVRRNFKSFIYLDSSVTDCKLTFAIADSANQWDWYPPNSNSSNPDAPKYEKGRWQAFDPDLFLPVAPWVSSEMKGKDPDNWPSNFRFIDSGWASSSKRDTVFTDCEIVIDQAKDAEYWMPSTVMRRSNNNTEPYVIKYLPYNMFFASRLFRRSSNIFYFAAQAATFWQNAEARSHISCASGVTLTFRQGRTPYAADSSSDYTLPKSLLWRVNMEDIDGYRSESSVSNYYLHWKTAVFISGLRNSSVHIPDMKIVTVNRKTTTVSNLRSSSQTKARLADGTGIALFSGVSGSTLKIDYLDTRYPLVDEWKYIANAYPALNGYEAILNSTAPSSATLNTPIAYWAEPSNGFMLFTYPEAWGQAEIVPMRCNVNNSLEIGVWSTRTQLSGIHGLHSSSVKIAYDFTTQTFDLRMFSIAPGDTWANGEDHTKNSQYNYESLTVSDDTVKHKGSWYLAAQRPCYWTQLQSDPGSAYTVQISNSTDYKAFLPCTPLFYLSEVYNCQVDLNVAAMTGYPVVSSSTLKNNDYTAACIPSYTLNQSLSGRRKLRQLFSNALYNITGALPHAGQSNARDSDPLKDFNARRALRVSLGFQIQTPARTTSVTSVKLTAAASCNNVFGAFSRVNIVSGAYNCVRGWCYELVPTCVSDSGSTTYYFTPYDNTDLYPIPDREDKWLYTKTPEGGASPIGPNLGSARKLWTLDNNISYASGEADQETQLCSTLSSLYATTEVGSDILDGDTLPHAGAGVQDLHILGQLTNWRAGVRKSSWQIYPSARSFPPVHWVPADGILPSYDTYASMSQFVSGGFLFALDAYNTADLSTILIASQTVSYKVEKAASLSTVPQFHPLHLVLNALTEDLPSRTRKAVREELQTSYGDRLTDATINELTEAIIDGRLRIDGDQITAADGNWVNAGLSTPTLTNLYSLAQEAGSGVTASQWLDDQITNPPADMAVGLTEGFLNSAGGQAYLGLTGGSSFLAGSALNNTLLQH